MNNNLVLVVLDEDKKKKPYLFECGANALHKGDKVIVETCKGEKNGEVIYFAFRHYDIDADIYRMLLYLAGAEEPLKRVKAEYHLRELSYEEEK